MIVKIFRDGEEHQLPFVFIRHSGQGRKPYGNVASGCFLPPRQWSSLKTFSIYSCDLQTGIPFLSLKIELPERHQSDQYISVHGFFFDGEIRCSPSLGVAGIGGDAPYCWEMCGNYPIKVSPADVLDHNKAWLSLSYRRWSHDIAKLTWNRRRKWISLSAWFTPEYLASYVATNKKVAA